MTFPLPRAAFAQHTIALGKTRAGKSSKLRLIVEHLLDHNEPVCVIDPKGDWWGLKSSADGKKAGYPVIIFGGEHADVPINEHSGAAVAELIATGNRPCIIDLGGWMVGPRTRFFIDFASTLFKLTKGARHLVIDECHNFAPQGRILDPDAGKMLHWANRLASEGAGKGITLISASQRPQKVHKDYVTSHETLIACRVIHPLDRNAIKDWIDGCADPQIGKDVMTALAGLQRSQAYVWSPEIGFGPKLVEFPMFSTYDSFKPQDARAPSALKGWASVNLDDVKSKLAAVVEEAKANDPKALKVEVARLNAELRKTPKASMPSSAELDPAALKVAQRQGYDAGWPEGWLAGERSGFSSGVAAAHGEMKSALAGVAAVTYVPGTAPKPPKSAATGALPPLQRAQTVRPAASGASGALPLGERAVLVAAVQFDGVDRDQLSVLTGYKRSSRDAYIQRLREKGFVEINGQMVNVTDAGSAALPADYVPLPTGDDLQAYWLTRLPEGERKVLAVLIASHPDAVARDQIDAETGYKRSTRDAYIQRMKSRRLLTMQGSEVRASETLFG